tara:strand:- start:1803 stop:2606 length:804 start_codon:yes stop_codon:yes gene_type:complete
MLKLGKSIKCTTSPSHDSHHEIIFQNQVIGKLWVEKGYKIDDDGTKSKSLRVFDYYVDFNYNGIEVKELFQVVGVYVDSTWKNNYVFDCFDTSFETSKEAKKAALTFIESELARINMEQEETTVEETPVEETTVEETLKVGSRVRHIDCKGTGLIKEVSIDHGDTLYGVHWDDEYWMYGFYKIEYLELENPVETVETTQTNNQSTTEEPSQVIPQPEEPTMAQPTKIIVVTYHSYIQKWFSFTPENMESILLDFDNIVEIQIIEQGQ